MSAKVGHKLKKFERKGQEVQTIVQKLIRFIP